VVLGDLPTPQVLIDHHRARRNIDRVQSMATSAGQSLRPHSKTHKSPIVARWQIDRGAVGICCAKVGEAEVMAAAGISNIRLPYPINPSNAPRILALMERGASISLIVDHLDVATGWSAAMHRAGRTLDVLIKVDVGFHRCGIDPGGDPLGFIRTIAGLKGLRLRGLLSHAGHAYHATSEAELRATAAAEASTLAALKAQAVKSGVDCGEISVGATPTLRFSVGQVGVTELRPGNYVYFDRTQVALGAASLDDCALTVLATVVTKHDGRIILDCGSKTLTNDGARGIATAGGFGAVLIGDGSASRQIDESLLVERLSEEHATVKVVGSTALQPGDRVRIVPNHSCVVSNLVDAVQLVEGDRVIDTLPVAARGRIA
jgi:D-serine deaminase-like pyridoxal phosphate-dependent protein